MPPACPSETMLQSPPMRWVSSPAAPTGGVCIEVDADKGTQGVGCRWTGAETCGICMEADAAVVAQGCGCRGSTGWAHPACLAQAARARYGHVGASAWTQCGVCRHLFTGPMQGALCQAWLEDTRDAGELDPARLHARLFHAFAQNCAGRCGDALRLYREALPAFERAFGTDSPNVLSLQSYMSVAMNDCGQHGQALALQDAVLARARALGAEHTGFWQDLSCSKADSLLALGRFHQAGQLLTGLTAGNAGEAPRGFVVKALIRTALCLQGERRLDEADHVAEETVAMARQVFGARHPYTVEACSVQAAGHLARHRAGLALQALSCVLDAWPLEGTQEVNAKTAVAFEVAASAHRQQGAYAKEEGCLQVSQADSRVVFAMYLTSAQRGN